MRNGDILKYVQENPRCNRLSLIVHIAHAVEFLHYRDIIHGDIRDSNVLVDDNGAACLTNFRSARRANDPVKFRQVWGTVEWNAPELLDPENFGRNIDDNRPSKASDVYALSLLFWQIFSGKIPFSNIRDVTAIVRIVKGRRPLRTQQCDEAGLNDELWVLIGQCWAQDEQLRPSISEVVREVERLRRQLGDG